MRVVNDDIILLFPEVCIRSINVEPSMFDNCKYRRFSKIFIKKVKMLLDEFFDENKFRNFVKEIRQKFDFSKNVMFVPELKNTKILWPDSGKYDYIIHKEGIFDNNFRDLVVIPEDNRYEIKNKYVFSNFGGFLLFAKILEPGLNIIPADRFFNLLKSTAEFMFGQVFITKPLIKPETQENIIPSFIQVLQTSDPLYFSMLNFVSNSKVLYDKNFLVITNGRVVVIYSKTDNEKIIKDVSSQFLNVPSEKIFIKDKIKFNLKMEGNDAS
jgi:hypothetical protein